MAKKERNRQIPVFDQAVKYLAMRNHTVFELCNKLKRKGYPAAEIESAVHDLKEAKYLNDEDFARNFAENLIKYKTFGYYGIKQKLRLRGIDDKLSESILREILDVEAEKKIALKAIGKSGKKEKTKLVMMLKRKGFRVQAVAETAGDLSY